MWKWENGAITAAAIGLGALTSLGMTAAVLSEADTGPWQTPGMESAHPAPVDLVESPSMAAPEPREVWVAPPLPEVELEGDLPFVAHSMTSSFSVRGRYAGALSYDDGALILDVARGFAYAADSRDDVRLVGVRLSIGLPSGDGWSLPVRGLLHPVDTELSPRGFVPLDRIRLIVPEVTFEQIEKGWITIEHELLIEDPAGGPPRRAWTYVFADREMTMRFIAGLDGC